MPQLTAPQFTARKGADDKLVVVTAYDYTMARLVDGAGDGERGVDAVLVATRSAWSCRVEPARSA